MFLLHLPVMILSLNGSVGNGKYVTHKGCMVEKLFNPCVTCRDGIYYRRSITITITITLTF